ncbi:GNAT family N-acetyltransferase [Aeromonas jandaei]|uniref:GNAT family N-acetyltransferase n=1 Tax=Aeromonas jandaei TaxID=650 RepID=UPI00059BDACD|nr:GNAT family N-acetyltransferase [Aeromonas jandaei]
MELLIEGSLWQPHWNEVVGHWQQQGHRWQLLLGKEAAATLDHHCAPWAGLTPDGVICPGALLAAWLDGDLLPQHHADPTQQILLSGSASLLTLAREQGLLTLGAVGADLALDAHADLGALLNRLLARRLRIPSLREQDCDAPLQLRALYAGDEQEIVRYCSDEAIARYTLNIPHPYPPESARDWLALCWRRAALGLGWSWAITLPQGEAELPLVGVISLHWNGELAWWVGVPWQGRGIATRAARLVKAFAFDQLHLPAITARHMPQNLASGRVMAKLGMVEQGLRLIDGHQPCEVRYWRLDRRPAITGALQQALVRWQRDERIAVVILCDPAVCEATLPVISLFLADMDADEARLFSDPQLEAEGYQLHCYPLSRLEAAEPELFHHAGGLLLKDEGDMGLEWLLQFATLLRQGPTLLTLTERRERLGWISRLLADGDGLTAESALPLRHRLMRLLVELPELMDELDGRWHPGPERTFARLARESPSLLNAYQRVLAQPAPDNWRALREQFADRFPECTLPFLDKGAQERGQFVE